jgi:hypothetical protein
MKKTIHLSAVCVLLLAFFPGQVPANSVPSTLIKELGEKIERTFVRVDSIQFLPDGTEEEDILIQGQQRLFHQSWRAQVYKVTEKGVELKWDSNRLITCNNIEFCETGPNMAKIDLKDDSYWLYLESCAPHACYDGILGFFVFSGASSKSWTAKVTAVDGAHGGTAKYDVLWKPEKDVKAEGAIAREILERTICDSTAISDPQKLPFTCSAPNK